MNRLFKKVLFFGIVIYFSKCSNNDHLNIEGNWYFFNDDTIYNEVFITDSNFLYFSEISELYGPFKYKIKTNRIHFFYNSTGKLDYSPKIKAINHDEIILQFKSQYDTLRRIEIGGFLLDSLMKEEDYGKFLFSFYFRKNKALNKSLNKESDNDTMIIKEEIFPE